MRNRTATEAAERAAETTAEHAGVRIETVDDPRRLGPVAELFASVWGSEPGQEPLAADVLRALVHSGGAVHVAYDVDGTDGPEPAGAAAAVFGPPRTRGAYSLIAASARPGRGIGFALKHAQRAWALGNGATSLTWTFDPLVSRNARFNLVKLGAVANEYIVDFYGPLADGTNDGDETDRLTVSWALDSVHAPDAAHGRPHRAAGAGPSSPEHAPEWAPDGGPLTVMDSHGLWCRVPDDIVALRRTDPGQAASWRAAVRDVFVPAMADGFIAIGMSRDNWYHLARQEQREHREHHREQQ